MFDPKIKDFSWEASFGLSEDRFIGRRWESNLIITVRNAEAIGQLIATMFKNRHRTDEITFNVLKSVDGYILDFEGYSVDPNLNAYANAIWCKPVIAAIPNMNHRFPVNYKASNLGFMWRTDREVMLEAFDELEKITEINTFEDELPTEEA